MNKSNLRRIIKECIQEIIDEGKYSQYSEYQTEIESRDGTGEIIPVTVYYEYLSGSVGGRSGMARFAEPDTGAQVEIRAVTDETGQEIELSSSEQETIQDKILADIRNSEER